MVDVKAVANPLFLREEELRQAIEMLFFAYRDFTGEPDSMLAELGLGRAHHRVIYFVGRNPGITVSELLNILKITKQSLSRVLSHLVSEGYINQRPGDRDRRQRLLSLTDKGVELEHRLTANQRERIAAAFRTAGADAVQGFRLVLHGIIDPEDRRRFDIGRSKPGMPPTRTAAGHR
ncbi:MAG: MarR family transcriptional regulator [Alphaproteobacteria bacterium]|nr:MarR family transcriptional regulator [Alphaproteobacteria bacterium]